ncbi:MAG: aldo/keto reductase, partial [Bdellovibrionales bacterium]|nr:aldo/keto reductase [Bdellovibrionales bacterium]
MNIEMEYRNLGRSGLRVSALSFGSWVNFGEIEDQQASKLMNLAYDHGINFFDNAETYAKGASESIMGKILAQSSWSRDSYCVSSKVFWGGEKPTQRGLSRKHIFDACHAALKRLQVDYLDLYFCHRPDVYTPTEEVVRSMNTLIDQGKILYWGTSEWTATQLQEAFGIAKELGLCPPTMEQPQYNLFTRQKVEKDFLPLYSQGLGTTIWSPLASGILTGKYASGIPEGSRLSLKNYQWLKERAFDTPEGQEKIEKTKKLGDIAKKLEMSLT